MDSDRPKTHIAGFPVTYARIISTVLIVAAFIVGLYIGAQNAQVANGSVFSVGNSAPPEDVDLEPLWKAWRILNEKYVPTSESAISTEEQVFGAIQGLTSSFGDPYTVFLPPAEAEIFQEDISGNFEGVGMEIGIRDSGLVVVAPLKNTPAERAGLRSGDRILKIDDVSAEGMSTDEAVQRIRGERGTEVVFEVAREGENELLTISVVRDVIEIPTIETELQDGSSIGLRDDGVFVIRLFNFSAISPGLFRNALREFIESGSDKLILDLRGNPGGFLEASVDMASWFVPTGKVIVTENVGENEEPRIHRSKGYDVFNNNLDMVVLINQGSASASEILAGALQEYGVAKLVGQPTFGKGSVQELIDVTDETSIKVTIARWVTPNGRSISDGGLEPDIAIEVTAEDIETGNDPQFDEAVRYLLEDV